VNSVENKPVLFLLKEILLLTQRNIVRRARRALCCGASCRLVVRIFSSRFYDGCMEPILFPYSPIHSAIYFLVSHSYLILRLVIYIYWAQNVRVHNAEQISIPSAAN
jgi:hypothetical protein